MLKKIINKFLLNYKFVRGDINLNSKAGALHKAWGHIFTNHLLGDYIEFGVYKGESFRISIEQYISFKSWLEDQKLVSEKWRNNLAKNSPLNKKIIFHGLDTFSGMPSNEEDNLVFNKNNFLSDYDKLNNQLKKLTVETILYKGLFVDSKEILCKNLEGRKAGIVNIDCDLYKSSIESLNIIEEYLQIGSIILFDDYNCFNADNKRGQRKALTEFI